jgi:adenosylhomocysteine nucleosidase
VGAPVTSISPAALTLACALEVEERAARKAGARAVRVGLAAPLPIPEGPIASFGLAGALAPELRPGTLLTATTVVDETGAVLWEGEPLHVPGARPAVLCSVSRVVDEPSERADLAERTGAVAVDMESGRLAASGRLAGAVRAISDAPDRPVGRLAHASKADGRTDWGAVVVAFVTEPMRAVRASLAARRALVALEQAARTLAGERA